MKKSILLPHGTSHVTVSDTLRAVLEKATFPHLVDIYMEVSKDGDGNEIFLEDGKIEGIENDGKELAASMLKASFLSFCSSNAVKPSNPYAPFVFDYDFSNTSHDYTYRITVEEMRLFAEGYCVHVRLSEDHQVNPNSLHNQISSGITKQQVITAFIGLHFNDNKWSKYLASPPKWLVDCRTSRGTKSAKKHPALWNPVLIAIALTENPRCITIKKLDAVFATQSFLTTWHELWKEKSEPYR